MELRVQLSMDAAETLSISKETPSSWQSVQTSLFQVLALQSYWSFAENSGSSHHLAWPHISQKPADMSNCATRKITSSSLPGPIEHPRESYEGNRKIWRSDSKKAKKWYRGWRVTPWPQINWHESQGRREEWEVEQWWQDLLDVSSYWQILNMLNSPGALRKTAEEAKSSQLCDWQMMTLPTFCYISCCHKTSETGRTDC
jgi:hypothetical protein